MINIIKLQVVALVGLLSMLCQTNLSAAPLFSKDDPDVIWKSGVNLFFRYTEQDTDKFGMNDHPAELDAEQISAAIGSIEYQDSGFLVGDTLKRVFTVQQSRLLGINLAKGFQNAKPDQDIIFVMEKNYRQLLIVDRKSLLAGRAFFKDGKINIIIGDYDIARSDAVEDLYDHSDQGKLPYDLNYGYRSRISAGGFKENLVKTDGIENKFANNQLRTDWFVIDVNTAVAALAKKNKSQKDNTTVDTEAMQQEAERLARERRQLRLEMAKMRKEMQEGNNKEQLTVEERLSNLDELHDKKLISDAEYEQKRKEILDDI